MDGDARLFLPKQSAYLSGASLKECVFFVAMFTNHTGDFFTDLIERIRKRVACCNCTDDVAIEVMRRALNLNFAAVGFFPILKRLKDDKALFDELALNVA